VVPALSACSDTEQKIFWLIIGPIISLLVTGSCHLLYNVAINLFSVWTIFVDSGD
jgi:hypothetical protein